jgi:hypothetical protein
MFLRSIAIMGALAAASPAAAAPAPLLNKTVLLNWSSLVTQRAPDGRIVTPRIDVEYKIYVSTAGRLFARASRSNRRLNLAGKADLAPGDITRNRAGEAMAMEFQGNRIVGTVGWAAGAARMMISFDASFTSCNFDIILGRLDGNLQRKGLDGVMYKIESVQIGSKTCSIRDGNVFADQ